MLACHRMFHFVQALKQFYAYVGLLPQAGTGIVVLSNSANPVDQIGQAMLRILNQPVARPLPPRAALPGGVR